MKLNTAIALLAHPVTLTAAASAITLASARKRDLASRFAIALPLGVLSSKAIKRAFPHRKPRLFSFTPYEAFPSGHGAGTAAFAGALADAFGIKQRWPFALAAIALVDVCRIRAREHRVHEALVGNALGIGAAILAGVIARQLAPTPAR